MNSWEMRKEIRKAKETIKAADNVADDIAYILHGRLRHVSTYTLKKLKSELRDFNAHTGKWRNE